MKNMEGYVTNSFFGAIKTEQKFVFEMGKHLLLAILIFESFGVSHDAIAPPFY